MAALIISGWLQEDQLDRDFNGANGETCTFWTRAYPIRAFTIYAVGKGENQYLRMDQFVSGATGRQAEHIVVNSGVTYVWNTWSKNLKEGVKFPNTPVSFREYFGLENPLRDITCKSWQPVKSKFMVPSDITFIIVTASEFEQNESFTPVIKTYIRRDMGYP